MRCAANKKQPQGLFFIGWCLSQWRAQLSFTPQGFKPAFQDHHC